MAAAGLAVSCAATAAITPAIHTALATTRPKIVDPPIGMAEASIVTLVSSPISAPATKMIPSAATIGACRPIAVEPSSSPRPACSSVRVCRTRKMTAPSAAMRVAAPNDSWTRSALRSVPYAGPWNSLYIGTSTMTWS